MFYLKKNRGVLYIQRDVEQNLYSIDRARTTLAYHVI